MPNCKSGMTTPVIQPSAMSAPRGLEFRMAERRSRPSSPPPPYKPVTVLRVMKYALASTLLAIVMGGALLALVVTDPLEDGGDSRSEAETETDVEVEVGGPPRPSSPGRDAPARFSSSEW